MAEQPHADPTPPSPDPAPPRRRKRTWLKVVVILLVAIVLIVALLPTIASTGPVKSYVVGKVNQSLNGELQVNDWSIGWASGVDIDGVKLLDAQGVTVLTISRVRVPLSLMDAAKGNYALGDVLIDKPDLVKLEIDENGTTNYEKLVKEDPSKPSKKPAEEAAGELPRFSGKVTIRELKGSVFKAGGGPPLMVIQPSDIVLDVPDSNGPIHNDVKLAVAAAQGKPGTITLVGNVDAIENNQVAADKLSADQTLEMAQLEIGALAPLLAMAGLDATLAGVGNGKLAVKVAAGTDVSASGELRFDNFVFGGAMLSGDTFKSALLRIPLQVTTSGAGDATRITAKETGVYFDQGSVVVSADAPLSAIENLSAQKPPGAAGTLAVNVTIPKLADLANQMPNTLRLVEGVKLTEGDLRESLTVTLAPDAATVSSTLELNNVKGTKDGQPLRPLDPIKLVAGATSRGGMDLRELALDLTSGFASVRIPRGAGESLAKLTLEGDVNLQKLREQAGQFTDALDAVEAGTGKFTLKTDGDLTKENSLVATSLDLLVENLNVVQPATTTQPAQPMLREPWLKLAVSGNVQRGAQSFVQGVNGLVVSLQTNDPQKPTVDLETSAELLMKPEGDATVVTAPAFKLTKLNVDIPAARNEFRTFLRALDENGLEPTAGRIALNNAMAGSYDGKLITIAADAPLSLVVANATLQKTEAGKRTTPIENRTVRVDAAGTFDVGGETFAARVSKLALSEERKLFNVAKSDDGELVVRFPAGGTPQGNGTLVLSADLVGLNQVLAAFGSPLIERQPDGSMDLQSGQLAGRVQLSANDKDTAIDGTIDLTNLTLTTSAEPIRNETINTVVKLTSPADGSSTAGSVNVVSGFVKATVDNLSLQLQKQAANGATTQPAVWEMVRSANVSADVESLPKAYALASAFTPPATQPAGVDTSGRPVEPEPPLSIQNGSAKVKAAVTRQGTQTNVDVSEIRLSNLAIAKGPGTFKAPRDVVVSLAATLDAAESIKQVAVSKLNGDLAVANLTLTEPLTITNLDTTPAARGALKLDGKIEDVSRLLEALAGQAPGTAYPYAGQVAMTQQISHAGGPIQLTGKLSATDFVVYQQGTTTPAFTEKQLDLTQDVTIDTAAKIATVKALNLNMASSGALKVAVTGAVHDWERTRQLDNVRADLTYDLAKLWPVIRPLISETPQDYEGLVIAGQAQRTFLLSGSYPATDASGKELQFAQAVKTLVASGGLAVQKFSYKGVDIEELELPVTLRDGVLVTQYADRPRDKRFAPPAKCNGGTINLNGVVVNLAAEEPLLSIGKNQKLLAGVTMNPLLSHNVLGKFINPAFVDPKEARGLIDVTVVQCENLPMGELITRGNAGKAQVVMSIREVSIGNKFINDLVGKIKSNAFQNDALRANIPDAKLNIENGMLSQDLDLVIEDFTLQFDGKVRLADQALVPLELKIPTAQLRGIDDNLRRYVPDAITIPITGTTTAPKWNLDGAVKNLVVDAGKKALLGNVLDRAGVNAPAPGTPGATSQPTQKDPVGGLLEGILGGQKKREPEPAKPPPPKQPSGSDRISQPPPKK